MISKNELPDCPVQTTVNLIGNKWKLLILRNLLAQTSRFGELQRKIDGISAKVLTENLRRMEDDGLIIRTIYAEIPPRVEYKLSELGEKMRPIIASLADWGTEYQVIVRNSCP